MRRHTWPNANWRRSLHALVPVGGAQNVSSQGMEKMEPPASPKTFLCILCEGMVIGAEPHDGRKTKPGTNKSRTRS